MTDDILPPSQVYNTPAPCYLRNPDDELHVAAAPRWIILDHLEDTYAFHMF